jgi:RimJ/RimL family protein N-acetyltransferase
MAEAIDWLDQHTERRFRVREMRLSEAIIRIEYFHNASEAHLERIGVDRALLPSHSAWLAFYEEDYSLPLEMRSNYSLVWEIDEVVVGFSTVDNLEYGKQAFMHLHIVHGSHRGRGVGTQFVKRSVLMYLSTLKLRRIYCQPNAYNVAPNRTLQSAGFRYEFTKDMAPSAINFRQPVTRWVFEKGWLASATI